MKERKTCFFSCSGLGSLLSTSVAVMGFTWLGIERLGSNLEHEVEGPSVPVFHCLESGLKRGRQHQEEQHFRQSRVRMGRKQCTH